MAAVAREIDEACNAVQLNGFFGKTFYFYNWFLFKVQLYLCVYLFLYLSIYNLYLTTLHR